MIVVMAKKEDGMNLTAVEIKAFVPAKDFETSKEFYQTIGFTMKWADEAIALMELSNCRFLLQNFYVPVHAGNFVMHLTVESVDDWYQNLRDQNVAERYKVDVGEPSDQPWGMRDLVMSDPSGVMWRIGQTLPQNMRS